MSFNDLTETWNISDWVMDVINDNYNVIDVVDIISFESDFASLENRFLEKRKEVYEPQDRYVIFDMDTSYYLPGSAYSLTTYNLVKAFLHNDMPLGQTIYITRNPNCKQVFQALTPSHMHDYNLPFIVNNLITSVSLMNDRVVNNFEFSVDNIEKTFISMLGVPRVHRNVFYNHISKSNLLGNIAVSYKGNDNVS